MSYGVCRTFIRGDGRAQHPVWWDEKAKQWCPEPLYEGTFDTVAAAVLWVLTHTTNLPPIQHHVYEEGNPFGGVRVMPKQTAPTREQLKDCGVIAPNIAPPQEN